MKKNDILEIIEENINSLQYILLEFDIIYHNIKNIIKIVLHHKERKISSDDCTIVAEIISRRLEIENFFDKPYDLIVESASLEREIKSDKEYEYFIDREFKIFPEESSAVFTKNRFFIGILREIKDSYLFFECEKKILCMHIDEIKKSRLYCDFSQILKKQKNNK